MLSKVSLDEVFRHYSEKMSSAGTVHLDLAGGPPSFRPPHCPPLKNILRALMDIFSAFKAAWGGVQGNQKIRIGKFTISN